MKNLTISILLILIISSCSTKEKHDNTSTLISLQIEKDYNKEKSDSLYNIISERLTYYCKTKPEISFEDNLVKFLIAKDCDTASIKKIILSKGKLEVWRTFESSNVFSFMEGINNTIEKLDFTHRFLIDSIEASKEFSFFNKLVPPIDNEGYFLDGPFAGLALQEDKLLIDSVLMLKQVTDNLPIDLKFYWGVRPENNLYPLIAINLANSKNSPIRSKMIKDASFETEKGNEYVLIKLKKEYYEKFALLTKYNIGMSLAIAIDNDVYSHLIGNTIIDNGEIVIYNKLSSDKYRVIASILKKGELPFIPKIHSIEKVKQ